MTTENKKTRTPKSFDSILAGAQRLTLKERVDLRNAIDAGIKLEVKQKEEAAKEAATIANGS